MKRFIYIILYLCMIGVAPLATEKTSRASVDSAQEFISDMEGGNVAAPEDITESEKAVVDVLQETTEQSQRILDVAVQKGIVFLPYLGIVLFILGIVVAVFSTKNKGWRRWGVRFAVIEAVIIFLLYTALVLANDYYIAFKPIGYATRSEEPDRYELIYHDTVEELKENNQDFLLLKPGSLLSAADIGRALYVQYAGFFAFVCVSVGLLFVILTKRDRIFARWAFGGMCIVIPVVLFVGYQYLKF